jgi:hypothetical protein
MGINSYRCYCCCCLFVCRKKKKKKLEQKKKKIQCHFNFKMTKRYKKKKFFFGHSIIIFFFFYFFFLLVLHFKKKKKNKETNKQKKQKTKYIMDIETITSKQQGIETKIDSPKKRKREETSIKKEKKKEEEVVLTAKEIDCSYNNEEGEISVITKSYNDKGNEKKTTMKYTYKDPLEPWNDAMILISGAIENDIRRFCKDEEPILASQDDIYNKIFRKVDSNYDKEKDGFVQDIDDDLIIKFLCGIFKTSISFDVDLLSNLQTLLRKKYREDYDIDSDDSTSGFIDESEDNSENEKDMAISGKYPESVLLKKKDKVKFIKGPLKGSIGCILGIDDKTDAIVKLDNNSNIKIIGLDYLEKLVS